MTSFMLPEIFEWNRVRQAYSITTSFNVVICNYEEQHTSVLFGKKGHFVFIQVGTNKPGH